MVKGIDFQKNKTKGAIVMNTKYYIAYGSNLNIAQMKHRCPTAKPVGTAVIKDYELLFKGSRTGSYLTIEPKGNSSVPVAIWEVTESDEKNLDRYEGFPAFYYKRELHLNCKMLNGDKKMIRAFVYIMHEERKLGIPTWTYIKCCADGYSDFGFNLKYLDEAIGKSMKGGETNET